jgi:hypothetical protein
MGEMADFALDAMMDEDEAWCKNQTRRRPYINEETGQEDPSPFQREYKPAGPGPCPTCNGPTHIVKTGPYGWFYGCDSFPKCKGRRSG